jgi:hypothetical protein
VRIQTCILFLPLRWSHALQDPQQAEFAGDNFIRYTGDVKQFSESQLYEITAQEIGSDIHMNALPTLTAKVRRESLCPHQHTQ